MTAPREAKSSARKTPDAERRWNSHPDPDPWVRVVSAHGFAADELISALQKGIRRGEVENSVLVAIELYSSSPELEEKAWRRLEVIAVEDVGFGQPDAPCLIHALEQMRTHFSWHEPDRLLFLVHGVRYLASCVKDRSSDEMSNWAKEALADGSARPNIPDEALDMHTLKGREKGRGESHFLREGALVKNELGGRDLTYRGRLLDRLSD